MDRTVVALDCSCLSGSDAGQVERLVRLHLTLRRQGVELRLTNASSSLVELIGFFGLLEVLRVEPAGEAEEREQPRRVEEEGELGDAAI